MSCPDCGEDLPEGSLFCPACGADAAARAADPDRVPPAVEDRASTLFRRGVLSAGVVFLSTLAYVLLDAVVLGGLVATVAAVVSLVSFVNAWGVRHGAIWALDALPREVRDLPGVTTYFWTDEHCPGCDETPDGPAKFCPNCGHGLAADPEPLARRILFAFARPFRSQPVEPPRTEAFRERTPGESPDRWLGVAVALMIGGYALSNFFGFVSRFWTVSAVTLATLVAPLAMLVWLRGKDRYEPEPWGLLLLAFGWGILMGFFVAPANSLLGSVVGPSIAGLTEELAKATILIFLGTHRVLRKEFNGPVDGLIYGACAGLGFAAMENVSYVLEIARLTGSLGPGLALRSISMLSHMFWTGITGGYLGLMMLRRGRVAPRDLFVGFLPAAVLHGASNAPWHLLFGGFGFLAAPVITVVSAWAFFKLLADALRDEAAWGYADGSAPVEEA